VCTASTNATVRTLPADCPKGKYNGTDGICVPCECSGNSEICENQSGGSIHPGQPITSAVLYAEDTLDIWLYVNDTRTMFLEM